MKLGDLISKRRERLAARCLQRLRLRLRDASWHYAEWTFGSSPTERDAEWLLCVRLIEEIRALGADPESDVYYSVRYLLTPGAGRGDNTERAIALALGKVGP